MQNFYQELALQLQNLPGDRAHSEMFPKRKGAQEVRKNSNTFKEAGVLLLLHTRQNKIWISLTQRHKYDGAHSDQVSFPGGKKEKTDKNIQATALRETQEEIGVSSDTVNVLGPLTELYIPVSNFIVQPYIGYLKEPPIYKAEESEVSEIFDLSLNHLMDKENLTNSNVKMGKNLILKNVPSFIYESKIIWGATALILNEFKEILQRPKISKILP